MAQITLNIPNAVAQRVLDGFAGFYGYSSTIKPDASMAVEVPNPEKKIDFAKRKLIESIYKAVRSYESEQAAKAASETAVQSVKTDISIT